MMDQFFKDNSKIIILMGKDYIHGLMEDNLKEIGLQIKWMGKEYLLGKTEESIEYLIKIRRGI